MPHILNIDDVTPGDVLLCRSGSFDGGDIPEVTGSKYTHAAICVRPHWVAEASGRHVKVTQIENLLETYNHIAVLHQPDYWSPSRVEKLLLFIDAALKRRAKFNCYGVRNFVEQKAHHQENLNNKLYGFFEQSQPSPNAERDSYFCSELVAAAHVAVGIIEPSAAVVYDPSILAPGELANDFTFGIFTGYLIPYPEYNIPEDDEFRLAPFVHEIFRTET